MSEQSHQKSNTESKHTELSEQYYKSRKQLMLYSGLFFIYEFIGIKIPTKPLPNIDIEIPEPKHVHVGEDLYHWLGLRGSHVIWRFSRSQASDHRCGDQ